MTHETTLDAFAAREADAGIQTTLSWSAEGSSCEDCGRTVSRRWRDGDRFVCTECKQWNRS